MNLSALTRAAGPWAHLAVGSAEAVHPSVVALERGRKAGAARCMRGAKGRTTAGLHDEMAAALQFPPHYGENWDALRDCLCDLAWLPPGPVVLALLDADAVLRSAPARQFALLVQVLGDAARFWNDPGGKRKATPFHLLVQTTSADEPTRWRTVGLELHPVDE